LLDRQAEGWRAYVLQQLPSFFFFLFVTIAWNKEISEPTRQIFNTFSGLVDMLL